VTETDRPGSQYRHKLPKDQRNLSTTELARRAGVGVGVSIMRCGPYWDVVARLDAKGKLEYIVTDCSVQGRKPLLVHGPVSRDAAIKWAKETALLFMSVRGGHIDDDLMGHR